MKTEMPLPRIQTRFRLCSNESNLDEEETELKRFYLPSEIVENIIGWHKEFQTARIKDYYYRKFQKQYSASLVKSTSRLKLYTRELKALGMKYRTYNSSNSFHSFTMDSKKCKRDYKGEYYRLKAIFI